MKLFVAGGTGVAGRRTVPLLVAAGHDVTVVSRGKDDLVRALGATPVTVDLFDAGAVKVAVAGHDGVVNLATSIPPITRMSRLSSWRTNDRIRIEASSHLVDAALAAGAHTFVQESIAFLVRSNPGGWVDEDSPFEPGYTDAALTAQANAERFAAAGGRGITLRFAQFYGRDAMHTVSMAKLLRRRLNPFLGPQSGYWTHIHLDDVASAVVAALDAPSGLYNVAEDAPATRGALAAACAAGLGVKPPRTPPSGVVGKVAPTAELNMRDLRIGNARFRAATGWAPAHPDPLVSMPVEFAAVVR